MYVQTVEIDTLAESLYFDSLSVKTFHSNEYLLIETALFNDLYNKIDVGKESGVIIFGPKGTGKSTSAVYLWKKLKDKKVPFLVFFAEAMATRFKLYFDGYIRTFCEGNCFAVFIMLC